MTRWFKGVSRAKTGERIRLLEAERQAKQTALMAECDKRLAEHPYCLCDCTDIRTLGCRITWRRKRGRILAEFVVFMEPDATQHVYRWRI